MLVLGGVAWGANRDDADPAPSPEASLAQRPVEAAAAARVLADLEQAVADHDVPAAESLAPAHDPAARRLLSVLVRNARALDLSSFRLRYQDEVGTIAPDGSWPSTVDLTWQVAGFDDRPARTEVLVRFVADEGRASIASVGGGDRRTPVWLSGPVRVLRTADTLVIDATVEPTGDARRISRTARAAVPVVRRVLPEWAPELVVEVPATSAGLEAALDAEEREYEAVAAVTAASDGSTGARAPVHVFVNARVFAALGATGAQVVMSHEATHVATQAAGSGAPLWLLEGFADYVALRDVRLPDDTLAAQIIRRVRRHGVPRELPDADEFATSSQNLGAAYESAWLACRMLAESRGEAALVRLYQAVDEGLPLDESLRRHVGFGQRELIQRWRERLSDLAG